MIDDSKRRFEEHARLWKLNLEPHDTDIHTYKDPITHAAWNGYQAAYGDYMPLWRLKYDAAMRVIGFEGPLAEAYWKELSATPWMDKDR